MKLQIALRHKTLTLLVATTTSDVVWSLEKVSSYTTGKSYGTAIPGNKQSTSLLKCLSKLVVVAPSTAQFNLCAVHAAAIVSGWVLQIAICRLGNYKPHKYVFCKVHCYYAHSTTCEHQLASQMLSIKYIAIRAFYQLWSSKNNCFKRSPNSWKLTCFCCIKRHDRLQ